MSGMGSAHHFPPSSSSFPSQGPSPQSLRGVEQMRTPEASKGPPSAMAIYGHHDDDPSAQDLREFDAARDRPRPGKYRPPAPLLVTVVSDDAMPGVRNLVGSVHYWHPHLQVWLYETAAGALSGRYQSEISLWQNVRLLSFKAKHWGEGKAAEEQGRLLHDLRGLNLAAEAAPGGTLESFATWLHGGEGPRGGQEATPGATEGAGAGAGGAEAAAGGLGPGASGGGSAAASGGRAGVGAASDVLHWEPFALLHALYTSPEGTAVIYLQNRGFLSGWCDNVLKALGRDGAFFVASEVTPGACSAGLMGYSRASVSGMEALHKVSGRAPRGSPGVPRVPQGWEAMSSGGMVCRELIGCARTRVHSS